ncbi:hypothetical protein M8C13_32530 [Crossiella sp. SN42]|uniref:hypothetical protein n=1 Tax=Crossiella sp. SN42 TaxID=2944808 RepID=UPI00207D5B35|nr:hypothetical protein [Crossiella sp. SN42]MCO1580491.1 hypothetical protein [Crossiella sp. SN42]
MSPIVCDYCRSIWDPIYLRNRSIQDIQQHEVVSLQQLDAIDDGSMANWLSGSNYPWSASDTPITAAYKYWKSKDFTDKSPLGASAAVVVQHAIYQATKDGKGCLACGFHTR